MLPPWGSSKTSRARLLYLLGTVPQRQNRHRGIVEVVRRGKSRPAIRRGKLLRRFERICYKRPLCMGGSEWLGAGFRRAGERYTSGVRSESFEKC
jgi:hypothetical protein